MQVEYQYYFRPANHWNIITREVYNVLLPFYINDLPARLKVVLLEKE